MFIDSLHPAIKPGFLRLPEAREFQKLDIYRLRELATRVEESGSHFKGLTDTTKTFPLTKTKSANSKKFRNRDTDEISREKLSKKEKSFLNSNILKGGGSYIFPDVQKKLEWIKWAKRDGLCMKCASKGHIGEKCEVAKEHGKESAQSRNEIKNSVHSMLMEIEANEAGHSTIDSDAEYLCSVLDPNRKDLILMMYDCEVNKLEGTALGDPGATMTYISSEYAKRANVRFLEKSTSRAVQLPNGNQMKILGYCEFFMKMGEWSGWVQAKILDLKAEFDVILGLSWFRQWKLIPDWDTLDLFVSTESGVQRIVHKWKAEMNVPKRHRLTVMREYRSDLKFNLISEKEAKRDLKRKDTQAMLYFVKESHGVITIEPLGSGKLDKPFKDLLGEYKDCFREDVPEGLPPVRDIDHAIETGEERPLNRNAFPLSEKQLREQTKQVEG